MKSLMEGLVTQNGGCWGRGSDGAAAGPVQCRKVVSVRFERAFAHVETGSGNGVMQQSPQELQLGIVEVAVRLVKGAEAT